MTLKTVQETTKPHENPEGERINIREKVGKKKLTIHEPATIRRNIGFSDDKIKISKNLNDFKKNPMFVGAIYLQQNS